MSAGAATGDKARLSANAVGVLTMLGAMACFVVNDTFVRLASRSVPTGEVMAIRGALASSMLLLPALLSGALARPGRILSGPMGLRMLGEMTATALFLWGFVWLPFAEGQAILQFTPLAVTAASAVILREQVGWRRWLASATGLLGVMLIVKPGTDAFTWWSIPLIGSVLLVVVRDLATRYVDPRIPTLMLALTSAVSVGLFGLLLAPVESWQTPSPHMLGHLTAAAFFLCIGYVLMAASLRKGEMSVVAPFRYSVVVYAMASGWLVWREVPDFWALLGIAVVIVAGLYTFHRERARRG